MGELYAAQWLEEHAGMELLRNRYRCKAGEIDLIMRDRNTIVFVEVKTRTHATAGNGLMAVDRRKQQRIARAAVLYLMENKSLKMPVRFDAVEVSSSGVIHIPNAFQPGSMFY